MSEGYPLPWVGRCRQPVIPAGRIGGRSQHNVTYKGKQIL